LSSNGSDGLAASLASFLVELFSLNEIGDEVAFYIATPPQQQEIIKETTQKTIELVKKQIGHKVSVSGKVIFNWQGRVILKIFSQLPILQAT